MIRNLLTDEPHQGSWRSSQVQRRRYNEWPRDDGAIMTRTFKLTIRSQSWNFVWHRPGLLSAHEQSWEDLRDSRYQPGPRRPRYHECPRDDGTSIMPVSRVPPGRRWRYHECPRDEFVVPGEDGDPYFSTPLSKMVAGDPPECRSWSVGAQDLR